ncbi:hypothetical protein EVG20_g3536 [Dentipellis fragilis]|uniref:DUF6697 domain-containing protein n=1 Tax=Dentipellis fragilis TaxID=205917 RepID=A0A4Y9Z3K3_9AGAM|nr:hypothetical protein EVG20_g3536 [Dentipellis fragilis]
MPDLDYDGKTAELAGLWDEYNTAQIRSLTKDTTRRTELLRECIESVLTDWLSDVWSVTYEFQTEFELVHKCLRFAANTVAKVANTKHSACDCFCSTYNLFLTLERVKSKGSVNVFHLRGIESFYLPLLWVWRDLILTMLTYGQERHKKHLPEMLDNIRRVVGWAGLEYLPNGGIKFDDHDETYGPAYRSKWLKKHRNTIETLTPRSAPKQPEYWSAAIKASMPDLLACVDMQMLDYFNEHPDQALYRRILRMTTPSRREAVKQQLHRTLHDYAYLSPDCFAVALDIFTQDRVFEKVSELLFKGAHILCPCDTPIYQRAVAALAYELTRPSSAMDPVLQRREYLDKLLAIIEKDLLDTALSIHARLLYVFSGLDDEEHAKELQNILGLQPGSATRQSRLKAWIAAVAMPKPLDWRAAAATVLGLPLPLPSNLSTNVQGEPDKSDMDEMGFGSNEILGLYVEPTFPIEILDGRDTPIPGDLQDLMDILKPQMTRRFMGWVGALKDLPRCMVPLSHVYHETVARMPFLVGDDVTEQMEDWISQKSPHDRYIEDAIRVLHTFVDMFVEIEKQDAEMQARAEVKDLVKAAVAAGFRGPACSLPAVSSVMDRLTKAELELLGAEELRQLVWQLQGRLADRDAAGDANSTVSKVKIEAANSSFDKENEPEVIDLTSDGPDEPGPSIRQPRRPLSHEHRAQNISAKRRSTMFDDLPRSKKLKVDVEDRINFDGDTVSRHASPQTNAMAGPSTLKIKQTDSPAAASILEPFPDDTSVGIPESPLSEIAEDDPEEDEVTHGREESPFSDENSSRWKRADEAWTSASTALKFKKKYDEDRITLQNRIDAVGRDPFPIALDPAIRNAGVSRDFMSAVYGSSPQGTFPTISPDKLAMHGLNDFMYINTEFNPFAPQEPGETALFFIAGLIDGKVWPPLSRVFVKKEVGQWVYMGQYKVEEMQPLSAEEWLLQSDIVRNTWVREIFKSKWGRQIRATIIFRQKKKRDLTKEELAKMLKSNDHFCGTSIPEIQKVFDEGKQSLEVMTMKCMDYDEAFQRRIIAKFAAWPGRSGSKKVTQTKVRARRPQTHRMARAPASEAESDASTGSAVDESEQGDRQSNM